MLPTERPRLRRPRSAAPLAGRRRPPTALPALPPVEQPEDSPRAWQPQARWHVLMVDDNPGDVRFLEHAFARVGVPVRLHVAQDGDEAIRFLRRQGVHSDAPRPHLVLLDLNLPGRDGRDVLAELKTDPMLLTIPTVVLSSSTNPDDVTGAYQLHANGYVTKPHLPAAYRELASSLASFWLRTARLPSP